MRWLESWMRLLLVWVCLWWYAVFRRHLAAIRVRWGTAFVLGSRFWRSYWEIEDRICRATVRFPLWYVRRWRTIYYPKTQGET